MTLLFGHAYTERRTLPLTATPRRRCLAMLLAALESDRLIDPVPVYLTRP
jgi:hypothetical protein